MLRTNNKAVKEKIRKYIMDGFEPESYGYEGFEKVNRENFSCVAHAIFECFYDEKIKYDNRKLSKYELFEEWTSGLCSMINTSYWYNTSAIELVGNWLEQTEEERNKYTESDAEILVTKLIYRELCFGCRFFR